MRPHKDLPAGSQKWAEDVDKMEQRIKDLEALVKRLSEMLRVDPTRPDLNVNPQGIAPAVNSADQQKLSGLADTATYNVADGQILTWDQNKQAWVPQTFRADGSFTPHEAIRANSAYGSDVQFSTVRNNYVASWLGWNPDGVVELLAMNGPTDANSARYRVNIGDSGLINLSITNSLGDITAVIVEGRTEDTNRYKTFTGVLVKGDGIKLPRLTTAQRTNLAAFAADSVNLVWDTTLHKLVGYDSGQWYDTMGNPV